MDGGPEPEGPLSELSLREVRPAQGPLSGGTEISVVGDGFNETTTVSIGGLACLSPELKSRREISCRTPRAERIGRVAIELKRLGLVAGEATSTVRLDDGFQYTCVDSAPARLMVWAHGPGDKVARGEVRAGCDPASVSNSAWDGSKVSLWGSRNEVIEANWVVEAPLTALSNLSVRVTDLTGPAGAVLAAASPVPASAQSPYDWRGRNLELFLVDYLQIKGLSRGFYSAYDERHIPRRLRRPMVTPEIGEAEGAWSDRPDHDQFYPDIAVPIEAISGGEFGIAARESQSVWMDLYIPKGTPAGIYRGSLELSESGQVVKAVPIEVEVKAFELPDDPSFDALLYVGYSDLSWRYLGLANPDGDSVREAELDQIVDRHFQLARRHKISLVDANLGANPWLESRPRESAWLKRLDGSLFSSAQGYQGPGVDRGSRFFMIGPYGTWRSSAWTPDETSFRARTDAWENWFAANAPTTRRMLYLADEHPDRVELYTWASWMSGNPGPGRGIESFATLPLPLAVSEVPALRAVATPMTIGAQAEWQSAMTTVSSDSSRSVFMYDSFRPACGTTAIEDDGVAPRELIWAGMRKGSKAWFAWHSTYYNDFRNGRGQSNVLAVAQTFGGIPASDPLMGETAAFYGNGNGVLFYPGRDQIYPDQSRGLAGPMASLRLKALRRGVQDADYVAAARAIDPVRTDAIVARMVPKAYWDYGVTNPMDPTWVRTDISWSTHPDDWEQARRDLMEIILQ